MQEQNDQCNFFITPHGYDSSMLTSKLNKKKVTAPIICPTSNEYIEVLAKVRTYGVLFHVTVGGHTTHNIF